ncbi:MAG: DUF4364 family protein [Oscillospiraceae bacterium]|nr:DUF4364 family protein [Oscillospiraceae bacterium]MDD4367516.1 DUF4364 family protein [Oscillospiraceae bacterium]
MSDTREQVTQKVILLYIASSLPGLTQDELLQIALGTMYMDYFTFSELYRQLLANAFLTQAQRKGETERDSNGQPIWRCDITPQGQQILDSLSGTLPLPLRHHLSETVRQYRHQLADEASCRASYLPDEQGRYKVLLTLQDKQDVLFELSAVVPEEHLARQITERWQQQHEALYPRLLQLLLNNQANPAPQPELRPVPPAGD